VSRTVALLVSVSVATLGGAPTPRSRAAQSGDARDGLAALVAALLGPTPLVDDLATLTDRIGGRPTGSPANLRAVDWALSRLREAGAQASRDVFTMPALWLERSASATIAGDGVEFAPRIAAMPFSAATSASGMAAALVDGGFGAEEDFKRLGERAREAFLLVDTHELMDVEGLFREYAEAALIEARAEAAGVAGVVYVGSRPDNLLYRHNVSKGAANTRPMIVIERDAGKRALRLLRAGLALTLTERLDVQSGPAYESYNVIGEIRGAIRPEEIVVMGAHLDSWDLGTGALDNGANTVLMIDVARQIVRLGLRPARTIRFVLWNGEEQGLNGSLGYTRSHVAEMDRHVVAGSVDIGCGRITGFFTNGRAELVTAVDRYLAPLSGLGPFAQINAPIVGTDNFDFLLQGVPNLVANQEAALYGPNYHARSDELDKCDLRQLRLNAAIVAAVVYGFAEDEARWTRQTRAEVDALVRSTDLGQQMKTFGLLDAWNAGARGLPLARPGITSAPAGYPP
jgi:hypothetical protein